MEGELAAGILLRNIYEYFWIMRIACVQLSIIATLFLLNSCEEPKPSHDECRHFYKTMDSSIKVTDTLMNKYFGRITKALEATDTGESVDQKVIDTINNEYPVIVESIIDLQHVIDSLKEIDKAFELKRRTKLYMEHTVAFVKRTHKFFVSYIRYHGENADHDNAGKYKEQLLQLKDETDELNLDLYKYKVRNMINNGELH